MNEVILQRPWNPLSYSQALQIQEELTSSGRVGWFLFTAKPVITLGLRASEKDILVPAEELKKLRIEILRVDRGGLVTYHGPEQILGFPFGTLEAHTGDSRAARQFVEKMVAGLSKFYDGVRGSIGDLRTIDKEKSEDCTGLWIKERNGNSFHPSKKLVSIGLKFERERIKHGFAMNILPLPSQGWINPCGLGAEALTSLFLEKTDLNLEAIAADMVRIY